MPPPVTFASSPMVMKGSTDLSLTDLLAQLGIGPGAQPQTVADQTLAQLNLGNATRGGPSPAALIQSLVGQGQGSPAPQGAGDPSALNLPTSGAPSPADQIKALVGPLSSGPPVGTQGVGPSGVAPFPNGVGSQSQGGPSDDPNAPPAQPAGVATTQHDPTALPQWGKRGFLGDLADDVFLGGSIQAVRKAERQRSLEDVQTQRLNDVWRSLSPDQRAAYTANPGEFGKAMADNYATHTVAGGSSLVPGAGMQGRGPGGGAYTAPLLGIDNGRTYAQTPTNTTITGFTGPKLLANGLDERGTGQQPVASDVVVPAGSLPHAIVTAGNTAPLGGGFVGGNGLDGNGGLAPRGAAPAVAAAVPAPGTPAAQIASLVGAVPPGSGPAPRGIRNNNPGNLRPLSKGMWADQTGVDGGNYAQFATPAAGIAAADKNLLAKQTLHGLTTLNGIIAAPGVGWDPSNKGYAAAVGKMVGVDPDQQIDLTDPSFRQKVLASIFQVENGRPVMTGPGAINPAFAGPASKPNPTARIAALTASAPDASGFSGASDTPLGEARTPHLLSATDPRLKQFAPGAAVEEDAAGGLHPLEGTGFTPTVLNSIYERNTKDLAPYTDAVPLVRAARQASKGQSGASDISLAESAARLFNPKASVRQGALNMFFDDTQGIPDKITAAVNQLKAGDANARFTPATRSAIMQMVEQRAAILRQSADPIIRAQQAFAARNKINPGDIMPPVEDVGPAPSSGGGQVVTLNPQNPNADFARLQKGDQYKGPDGVVRTK